MPAFVSEPIFDEFLAIDQGKTGLNDAIVVVGELGDDFRREEIRDALADDLAFRVRAQPAAVGDVVEQVTACRVLDVDVVRQVVDEGAQQLALAV